MLSSVEIGNGGQVRSLKHLTLFLSFSRKDSQIDVETALKP